MDYFQVGHWSVSPVSTGASTQEFSPSTSLTDHLRLASDTDDPIVTEKLAVARKRIEGRTSRVCFRQQFDLAIDRFPCNGKPIRIPKLPLVSVDRVQWYGTTGGVTTLSTDAYFVDTYSEPGRLCLVSGNSWPTGTRSQVAGVIRFTAGYSTTPASGIPDPLVEAIRKLATELYENREGVAIGVLPNELPFGIDELLSDYVLPEIG